MSSDVDLPFDERNTARPTRGRFQYQDECVALRCIGNLVSEAVSAVVVEWSTDYIAVLDNGEVEFVSVKHRDPGQGDWSPSGLGPVLRDLHRVWREAGERCWCTFASSAAPTTNAVRRLDAALARYVDADRAELRRFRQVLTLPDPPLPRRTEITAVAERDLGGALLLLGRTDRYAKQCYRALVDRIAAVATETPDSPVERIARLTGPQRDVAERTHLRIDDVTLTTADLRDLVLATDDECARAAPRPIRAGTAVTAAERRGIELGGEDFLPHGAAEESSGPDGSYRELRTAARSTGKPDREVWLSRLEVVRSSATADRRRSEFADEMRLHATVPGLPVIVAREAHAFATVLDGAPLTAVYGPPPYPAIVLDAFLRGLPMVARVLSDLHAKGRAHRALRPEVLIASRNRLWLRDVGLATTAPAAGEGPDAYRAPEQERPILTPPGPATDVYQLAALVYHLATGQTPGRTPPPPSILFPGASPALDDALLSVLTDEPGRRPGLTELVTELRRAFR